MTNSTIVRLLTEILMLHNQSKYIETVLPHYCGPSTLDLTQNVTIKLPIIQEIILLIRIILNPHFEIILFCAIQSVAYIPSHQILFFTGLPLNS